jgi:ABC-type antimicrobial peptide transport system permease subunit
LQSLSDVIDATVAPRRTNTILLTVFGGLAVVLAAIGVFAVLSYGVATRTREIGVRVALGAQRGDVVGLIMRQGVALTGVGIVVGLAGAFALSRFVSSILYEVSPHDARVFVAAPVVLALVAAAATLLPALRATRVDPLTALRED